MASAADDARAGVLVRRKPYPPGEKGIRMSLTEMSERIRAGAPTAVMKSYVGNVLRLASFPRSVRAKTAAILEHVRQVTGYAPDAPYTEAIQSAAITLRVDGAPICIPIGDCDDLTVAGATLLAAAGMQVRLVRQKFGADDQQHVLCEVLTEDGVWYPFDASHPSMRAGEKARASDETYHDPWDQSTGFDGQAQLVGIGGLPVFMMTEDGWQKLAPETELGATRSHEHWIPAGPGVLRAVRPQAFGAPPPQREQPRRVEIDPRPVDQGGVIGDLIREARSRIAHKRGLGDIVGPMSLGTAAAASGAIVLTSTAIALIIRRARSK